MDFKSRIDATLCPVNKRLFKLMELKKSNLCLAADVGSAQELFDIADRFGPHIVVLKTHVGVMQGFHHVQHERLIQLKHKHQFLVFQDSKFADIGRTNLRMYTEGDHRINYWADLVTAHVISGFDAIRELSLGNSNDLDTCNEPRGCLLVAQMSCRDSSNEVEKSRRIAEKLPEFVSGFVSQSTVTKDLRFIQFTPGVNIGVSGDSSGQQYVTPEEAVGTRGADIIIVGSGILKVPNPLERLFEFKERGWASFIGR